MTKISRYKLDQSKKTLLYNFLWKALTHLENREQVRSFFYEFFTPTEREMFAKRLYIAKMLRQGNTYQTIQSYLSVINATISRTSNIMKSDNSELAKVADHLIQLEEKDKDKLLKQPALPAYRDSGTKIISGISKALSEKARKKRRQLSVDD